MDFTPQQISTLRLFRTEGIGPVFFKKALEKYGTASAALQALANSTRKGKAWNIPTEKDILKEAAALQKLGGTFVFMEDETYPAYLKHIADPPPVLSVLGNVTCLNNNCVAIVGNRNASANAMAYTQTLATTLGEQNITVVSGLARGIDTAAHTGALNAKALTIAVVAGGVDHIYPPENKLLRKNIMEHGCVISEMPLGTMPTAGHFPRRNRIISGISKAVAVIEATKNSGSLITARLANEQGRDVFAMPGSPADPRAQGPNYLLKNGANMLETADDILNNLPTHISAPVAAPQQNTLFAHVEEQTLEPENTTEEPQDLKSLLSSTPVDLDVLLRLSGLSEADLHIHLTELEIMGEILRHPGGKFSLAS